MSYIKKKGIAIALSLVLSIVFCGINTVSATSRTQGCI